jgi:hypothetical protein
MMRANGSHPTYALPGEERTRVITQNRGWLGVEQYLLTSARDVDDFFLCSWLFKVALSLSGYTPSKR